MKNPLVSNTPAQSCQSTIHSCMCERNKNFAKERIVYTKKNGSSAASSQQATLKILDTLVGKNSPMEKKGDRGSNPVSRR